MVEEEVPPPITSPPVAIEATLLHPLLLPHLPHCDASRKRIKRRILQYLHLPTDNQKYIRLKSTDIKVECENQVLKLIDTFHICLMNDFELYAYWEPHGINIEGDVTVDPVGCRLFTTEGTDMSVTKGVMSTPTDKGKQSSMKDRSQMLMSSNPHTYRRALFEVKMLLQHLTSTGATSNTKQFYTLSYSFIGTTDRRLPTQAASNWLQMLQNCIQNYIQDFCSASTSTCDEGIHQPEVDKRCRVSATARGITLHPDCRVCSSSVDGLGIYTSQEGISAGDRIITVPEDMLINIYTALLDPSFGAVAIFALTEDVSAFTQRQKTRINFIQWPPNNRQLKYEDVMILYLLYILSINKQQPCKFSELLNHLPTIDEVKDQSILFAPHLVIALLQNFELQKQIHQITEELRQLHHSIQTIYKILFPHIFNEVKFFTYEYLVYAKALLNSRSWVLEVWPPPYLNEVFEVCGSDNMKHDTQQQIGLKSFNDSHTTNHTITTGSCSVNSMYVNSEELCVEYLLELKRSPLTLQEHKYTLKEKVRINMKNLKEWYDTSYSSSPFNMRRQDIRVGSSDTNEGLQSEALSARCKFIVDVLGRYDVAKNTANQLNIELIGDSVDVTLPRFMPCFIPIVDLMNHSNFAQCETPVFHCTERIVTIYSQADISVGSQIYLNYGPLESVDSLLYYGFVNSNIVKSILNTRVSPTTVQLPITSPYELLQFPSTEQTQEFNVFDRVCFILEPLITDKCNQQKLMLLNIADIPIVHIVRGYPPYYSPSLTECAYICAHTDMSEYQRWDKLSDLHKVNAYLRGGSDEVHRRLMFEKLADVFTNMSAPLESALQRLEQICVNQSSNSHYINIWEHRISKFLKSRLCILNWHMQHFKEAASMPAVHSSDCTL